MTQKGLAIKIFFKLSKSQFFGNYRNALMHQKLPPLATHAIIYFYLFKIK